MEIINFKLVSGRGVATRRQFRNNYGVDHCQDYKNARPRKWGVCIRVCIYWLERFELLLLNNIVRWIQMSLTITKDSNVTLKYFQRWQRMINPGDDTHPNHHDCAILITKYS